MSNKLTKKQKDLITKIKNGSTLHHDAVGWYLHNTCLEPTIVSSNTAASLLKRGTIKAQVVVYTLVD